jgi:nicotinate dehydrogenase subunit A
VSEAPENRTIVVNGTAHTVRTEPDTALLHVLRNHLGLRGSRFGCGLGVCGACLVLVDGRPEYSCVTPLWSVAERETTTVEGVTPHPVQRALIAEQAGQCGYCLSGIVIRAVALLRRQPHPTEAQVRAELDGNLCRCGAHNRIVRAVLRAADEGPAEETDD